MLNNAILTLFPHAVPIHIIASLFFLLCNILIFAADVTQRSETSSPDILMQSIKSTKNTTDILELIRNHHSIMNGKHVIQALKSLFELEKNGK